MGFFATFWVWLQQMLSGYIGNTTFRVASALEPAVVTMATVYVMVWGFLLMTGRIEEPIGAGLRRIVTLSIVLGVGLHLWLYNAIIVDTFYSAPSELAAAVVGAGDPVATIDAIWSHGGALAEQLWLEGTVYTGSSIGFFIVASLVYALIGVLCVYTMFLIALSSIASAVLLALGPLFIAMLMFDGTRRFFEAWTAQLFTYALICILTVLVGALMLHIVESYAEQTAARGPALHLVDAFDTLLVALLVLLLLRQIMPIAAGLATGLALNSFGMISRSVSGALRPGRSFGASAFNVLTGRHAIHTQRASAAAADVARSSVPERD